MATVKFVSYRGGSSHISRTNDYLADGHGDDPLDRTNRYITGSHARGARCVGVNCPSDPALASALMASLRAAYEAGRRGRRTRRRESDDTVRCCFAAMAGLMGVPMEQVEQALPPPRPHPTPEQQARAGQARDDARRQIDAAFAMRRSGLAALYELAGQDIEELRRRRRNRDALLQWTPVLGPAALMLALAYFIACELLQGGAGSEAELERHLAETRRLMEEIHFHNEQIGHCLARAQTLMDLEQAGEDRHAIEAAWAEFDEKCAWLEDRAATLRLQEEALLGEEEIFSGVQTLDRRLREIEARRGERDLALAAEAEYRLCADRPWAAPQHDDPLTYAPMLLDR